MTQRGRSITIVSTDLNLLLSEQEPVSVKCDQCLDVQERHHSLRVCRIVVPACIIHNNDLGGTGSQVQGSPKGSQSMCEVCVDKILGAFRLTAIDKPCFCTWQQSIADINFVKKTIISLA